MKTSTVSTSQTSLYSQPKILNLIRKSTIFSKQYEKVVKNLIGVDNHFLVKTLFFQTQYNKVFKNQELLYKNFKTKNVEIKIGYIAYHDPNFFFFIIYLANVNMFIVNNEIFYLVPQFTDQGILKKVFINHVS